MDLDLLNVWITNLGFEIKKDKLYLQLKAHYKDPINFYVMYLSNNKDKILEFFGFDTSIDYDHLTEKNVFEYLCTSTKLNPEFIMYTGFTS